MFKYKDIEEKFNIPFDEFIEREHFFFKKSIRKIALDLGTSHTFLLKTCKGLGIKLRSKKEASSLNMKRNNPSRIESAKNKRALSMESVLRERNLPQEIFFIELFKSKGVNFLDQYPVGPYNIDFFLPDNFICLEIDSTSRWGKKRRSAALVKDSFLKNNGFKVLRINKNLIKKESIIMDILKANNII